MIDKGEYLAFWGYVEGTPEGEAAWTAKVAMMEGRRFMAMPMVIVPQDVCYDSPIDGRPITSRHARKEDLARSGCVEYDPGMKQDADRRRQDEEAALDRSIERHVEESIGKMAGSQREKLANELVAGATAEVVRTSTGG